MPRQSWRELALAVAAYTAIAIVWWWPLPAHVATTTVARPFGDPLLNTWILAWDAQNALHGFRDYWAGLFFHPYPDVVAYSEHLLGIALFTAPLQWLTGNPVFVFNVATIASTVFVGFGVFLLTRELTGRADAALLAGLAAACSPYRLAQAYHLQVLVSGWMPIALCGLHRYMRRPSPAPLVLFVVAFVLQGLSNGYFLYFTAIAAALVVAHGLTDAPHDWRVRVVGLAAAAGAILVAIAPVALAYARVRREQGFARTLADIAAYSATPEAYASISSRLVLWNGLLPAGRDDLALFPGAFVVLLAVVAVGAALRGRASTSREQRSYTLLYAAMVVVAMLLSFGPRPMVFGWALPISGPYGWLMAVVPGLDGLRAPARLAIVVHLGLAVLAAFGFLHVTRHAGATVRRVLLAGMAAIVAIEGYGGPQGLEAFPTADMREDERAYAWLAAQAPGPTIELPVGEAALATRHLYRTLTHGNRIVNGYSGYGSVLQDFIGGPPFTEVGRIDAALAMARAIGVRWIVVHPTLYEYPEGGAGVATAIAGAVSHVARTQRFGSTLIAELRSPLAVSRPLPDSGWTRVMPSDFTVTAPMFHDDIGRITDGDAGTRWSSRAPQGGDEWVVLSFAELVDVAHLRLDVGRRSLGDYPRGLLIEHSDDGAVWTTLRDVDVTAVLVALGQSMAHEPRTPGIDVALPPNRSRHLRVRPAESTRVWFWSVDELRVWRR